jgi:hypothetical protein
MKNSEIGYLIDKDNIIQYAKTDYINKYTKIKAFTII